MKIGWTVTGRGGGLTLHSWAMVVDMDTAITGGVGTTGAGVTRGRWWGWWRWRRWGRMGDRDWGINFVMLVSFTGLLLYQLPLQPCQVPLSERFLPCSQCGCGSTHITGLSLPQRKVFMRGNGVSISVCSHIFSALCDPLHPKDGQYILLEQYLDHVLQCCYLFSEGDGDTGGLGGKGPNLNGDEGGEVCCRNIVSVSPAAWAIFTSVSSLYRLSRLAVSSLAELVTVLSMMVARGDLSSREGPGLVELDTTARVSSGFFCLTASSDHQAECRA